MNVEWSGVESGQDKVRSRGGTTSDGLRIKPQKKNEKQNKNVLQQKHKPTADAAAAAPAHHPPVLQPQLV